MSERNDEIINAVFEVLGRIPGVHGGSIGLRWVNARMTEEDAIVLYVERKLPLDQVPLHERIPREFMGMRTDVQQAGPPRRLTFNPFKNPYVEPDIKDLPEKDSNSYSTMLGGIRCQGGGESGTLGFIAQITVADPDNKDKYVVVSAQHVFAMGESEGVGGGVYQPVDSSSCCGKKIGTVLRSVNTTHMTFNEWNNARLQNKASVDASIGLLKPDVKCLAEVQLDDNQTQLVKAIVASSDITKTLPVRKRGMRTGEVAGRIECGLTGFHAPGPKGKFGYWKQMIITPSEGDTNPFGTIRFAAAGDSGSAVMTRDGTDRIVGLLWAAFEAQPKPETHPMFHVTKGVATDINDVMAALKITPVTRNVKDDVITVPQSNVPAKPLGEAPAAMPMPASTRMMLDQARKQIEETEHGRAYAEVFRQHQGEVRTLVRTNRRVGAIWKRYGGQSIVQAMIDAISRPDMIIAANIGKRSIAECAARIASVLRRYGSAALARDASVWERVINALPGRSYNQLLARLRAGEAFGS